MIFDHHQIQEVQKSGVPDQFKRALQGLSFHCLMLMLHNEKNVVHRLRVKEHKVKEKTTSTTSGFFEIVPRHAKSECLKG